MNVKKIITKQSLKREASLDVIIKKPITTMNKYIRSKVES